MKVSNLTVFVLGRPRHADLIDEIRAAGAHAILHQDGDVVGALMVCTPQRVDLLIGTGGIPEGLLAACSIKAMGGALIGRLNPQSEAERRAIEESGCDVRSILRSQGLVKSEQVFRRHRYYSGLFTQRGDLSRGQSRDQFLDLAQRDTHPPAGLCRTLG